MSRTVTGEGPPAPLPEVREDEASPEIAAIYAEIRAVTGISIVNLIYRHFAALPGALPWVWPIVRQLYVSLAGSAALARLGDTLRAPAIAPFDAPSLHAAGVSGDELAQAGAIVAVYNRGNLLNVLGLTTVLRVLDEPPSPGLGAHSPAGGPRQALEAIPPLPKLQALDPQAAAAVRSLADLHRAGAGGIVPSLYLHLGTCPNLLAVLPERLRPLLGSQAFGAERERLLQAVSGEAETLRGLVVVERAAPAESKAAIAAALATFAGGLIPEMVLVGLAIAAALPEADRLAPEP